MSIASLSALLAEQASLLAGAAGSPLAPPSYLDLVRNALATVTGLVGAFEGFGEGEPFVRRIGDHTVVDIPLRYESSDMKARVAFDTDEQVAGLFILVPQTP